MRRILVLIVAGSAACTRPAATSSTPTEPDAAERQLAEANVAWIEHQAEGYCACADLTCHDRIAGEMDAWFPEHFGEARLDAAQSARMREMRTKVEGCNDAMSARTQADIDGPAAAAIAEMKVLEDRMCACTDLTCVKRVSDEFEALGTKHADTKASESEIQEATVVVGRITECATRAAGSP